MARGSDENLLVAYLGPPSSYTHLDKLLIHIDIAKAAAELFDAKDYAFQDQKTIKGTHNLDVFLAVQSSPSVMGVVPFENSSNGAVDFTLDCLIDRGQESPDVLAYRETYLDVQHCLMGHLKKPNISDTIAPLSPNASSRRTTSKTSVVPHLPIQRSQSLTDLQCITDVYSHPQALGQCREFLSTYLKRAEQHEEASTSKAASIVAQQASPNTVAIASKLAAEVHGLDIMATNIQDSEDNTTRFLVLQRRDSPLQLSDSKSQAKWKALLALSVDNDAVGALADALHVFKQHDLNLTNIDKRPNRLKPWHYVFIVEFECVGSSIEVNSQIGKAVEDLGNVTESCKGLGRWKEQQHPSDH
ncbi:MAG: hypothetical protein Q9217_005511 [Psora testacea]